RVDDVATKKRAAAIELKIEIAFVSFGLDKKLDATVFPDFGAVICPNTADILVADMENSVDVFIIVQQTGESLRTVGAAFRAEVFYFENFRREPRPILPFQIKLGCIRCFFDGVNHVRSLVKKQVI